MKAILSEAEVIAWVARSWRLACRQEWAWDGYYWFLVEKALDYLLSRERDALTVWQPHAAPPSWRNP